MGGSDIPAVYVSSAIAHSNWWSTALIACRLGLVGFIVPYMFYYAPALLLQGNFLNILLNSATAFIGAVSLSAGVMGFFIRRLCLIERLIMIACGFFLIDPNFYTDILAIIPFSYMYLNQRFGFSIKDWIRILKPKVRGT